MQFSTTTLPATHAVTPSALHAPTPQLPIPGTKSSSINPSQSSSIPLQATSATAGLESHRVEDFPVLAIQSTRVAQAPTSQDVMGPL